MSYRKEREILEAFGCKNIEYDNLINNYYIRFDYKGQRYVIEHILNVYGAEVDFWELCHPKPTDSFGTLESLLDCIK
jgi:hypothetical protein